MFNLALLKTKSIQNQWMLFGDIISKLPDFSNYTNNINSKDNRKRCFLKKREKNFLISNKISIN
jgi:hypothetical protein